MFSSLLMLLGFVLLGALLYRAALKSRQASLPLVERIDALLPQTQCRQCGYPGCKPYAQAIVDGQADINQCPPGGERGIRKLAVLLDRPYKPLNPSHGVEKPRAVAFIDENACIGCTLCIQACPVDAIVGAAKQMHTVVAEYCTGCELCVAPCPVDCISMLPVPAAAPHRPWMYPVIEIIGMDAPDPRAAAARERHEFRQLREQREKQEKTARLAAKARELSGALAAPAQAADAANDAAAAAAAQKKALIAAAMARAQMQKAQVKPANTSELSAEQRAKIAEIEARRAGSS